MSFVVTEAVLTEAIRAIHTEDVPLVLLGNMVQAAVVEKLRRQQSKQPVRFLLTFTYRHSHH